MYLTLIYVTVITFVLVHRYDLDYRLYFAVKALFSAAEHEEEPPTIEEIYPVRNESFYDEYDARMEKLKKDIDMYNGAPSNAPEYDSNVHNLPHNVIPMEIEEDIFPAVEEEGESGQQEIAR